MDFFNNIFVILAQGIRGSLATLGFAPNWIEISMGIVYTGVIIGICTVVALFYTVWERKLAGYIQYRPGPNRLGPNGWFQGIADAIKLLTKEDVVPCNADKAIHLLAPILIFVPTILALGVIPFGENMAALDLNLGLFYLIAVTSLTVIPIFMAGWGSNNKYSLLGAMRAVAQMVSYEIPLVFSLLGVIIITGTLQISEIVEAQSSIWFVFLQPLGFIIYIIAATAETNRAPFDLPEGETELTAGYHTEYSGMKFALFFLAEYCNLFVASSLAVLVFLGGWHGPILPGWIWFIIKTFLMMSFFIWIRWTFPRIRIDHLMNLGWKILVPLSLLNIFLTGIGMYIYLGMGG
ncbi:NADH dehydrogenase subunit H [Desulfonispora thiosulfatigenes DSM 11270]|uniref:NADH-quinone oxidoreductase subunit H n=1 Tax=Desulfonispora thiosulfatigenes DSM 11270 TaxID=656914 RepID=A0A1W1VKM1_DESTI|nr:NADH-quinone oxidoreductase subunit NuoH [Desulfonispora thiosulfatigenes]SMB93907.1 NADH dehydrogenase subunit H [Desulfonispora thiosulfatigenes DSM 11270]